MSYFGNYFGSSGEGGPGTPTVSAPDTEGPVALRPLSAMQNRVGANYPPLVVQVVHGANNTPLPLPDPTGLEFELKLGGATIIGTPSVVDPEEARARWPASGVGDSVLVLEWPATSLPGGVWQTPGEWNVSLWARYDGGKEILAPQTENARLPYTVHPRHPTTAAA